MALLFVFILAALVGVAMVGVKALSLDAEADRISERASAKRSVWIAERNRKYGKPRL